MSLFRKEAVSHQSERLTGTVSLAQPLSLKLTVTLLVITAVFIIVFLFNAQYARKETVRGFLKPNKGVIKSYAVQGGIIEKLWIKEGDKVTQGQTLATIVVPQSNSQGIDLSTQLIAQLNDQLLLIADEIKQHQQLRSQETQNLNKRKQALKKERWALKSQYKLSNEKLLLLQRRQNKLSELNKKGFISTIEKERQQQSLLEAKQSKQNIARLLLQQQNDITQVTFNLTNIPQQYSLRINNLKRQQADIKRQLAQINNNHRYVIKATNAGIVTGIQVVKGESINANKPVLHIIPENSTLIAELLLPTRSAGFVAQGNIAKLRFDAFPYQRFGFITSEISQIDQTLISPNEAQLPIELREPVYRLKAQLNQQQITAYGKKFKLKSGMLFEADIMLEQRSLIQWLLEPIYSLKGRIS